MIDPFLLGQVKLSKNEFDFGYFLQRSKFSALSIYPLNLTAIFLLIRNCVISEQLSSVLKLSQDWKLQYFRKCKSNAPYFFHTILYWKKLSATFCKKYHLTGNMESFQHKSKAIQFPRILSQEYLEIYRLLFRFMLILLT